MYSGDEMYDDDTTSGPVAYTNVTGEDYVMADQVRRKRATPTEGCTDTGTTPSERPGADKRAPGSTDTPATQAGLRALFDEATMPEQIEALRRRHPKVVAAIEREASASAGALYIPGFDWSTDVGRLTDWADHFLRDHNCDHEGYETLMGSRDRVRAALAAQPAAETVTVKWKAPEGSFTERYAAQPAAGSANHPDDGHDHWYACVRCGVDNGLNEATE